MITGRFSGRVSALGASLAMLLTLAACQGDNLFEPGGSGGGGGTGPDREGPSVEIQDPQEPAASPIGDSLLIRARIQDDVGVDSVVFMGLSFRGDPDLGTDTTIVRFEPKVVHLSAPARDTVLTRYVMPSLDTIREDASIFVLAYDTKGNIGTDSTSLVLGGPRVELLNIEENQTFQAGLTVALRVRAQDPQLIRQLRVEFDGVVSDTVVIPVDPPLDSITVDTIFNLPASVQGDMSITARALNMLDVEGQDGPFMVNVTLSGQADTIAPRLSVDMTSLERLETRDSLFVEIEARDNTQGSGIARTGYTVLGISPSRNDTVVMTDEANYSPPRTGNLRASFNLRVFNVDTLTLPDTLIYEVHAYAVDQDGNCAAAIVADSLQALSCDNGALGGTMADGLAGSRIKRTVVAGRTVLLPNGGTVLDAVVDTVRRNLLMANIDRDQVEVFRLQAEEFMTPIAIGSEPWGLDIAENLDTLVVANSGGTNLSNIYLGDATGMGAREDVGRRLYTPDVVLYEIERKVDALGRLRYINYFIPNYRPPGFSDRPQYLAVDSVGRRLYSTKTTTNGDWGTIRKAWVPAGQPDVEVKLFLDHAQLTDAGDFTALGHIDDVNIVSVTIADTINGGSTQTDRVYLIDHTPGNRAATITNAAPEAVETAAQEISGLGSDVVWGTGRWDVSSLGFKDTTYVSRSGDRGWVVFGEGARSPLGRVIMFDAGGDSVSHKVSVADIMSNADETVQGIGLNQDGTLGVARGFQAYFFTPDLRTQGMADLPLGGAGAALHPLHADYPSLYNTDGNYYPDTHLAFLGTGNRTIEIIDAFHFNLLGRIHIRDVVIGPLKATLPFPEDNAGRACATTPVVNRNGQVVGNAIDIFADADGNNPYPVDATTEDSCIVLKLFGTTSSGGVVVVDVRKRDILRNHPARP